MLRIWAAVAAAAIPVASAAQDWPRLADGRAIITINGVRFALPTDHASLHEFQFGPAPADLRTRILLKAVLDDPEKSRALFSEWGDVNIGHVNDPRYPPHHVPKDRFLYGNAPDDLRHGDYHFSIGSRAARLCNRELDGWLFIYGNINAPAGNPPFDSTNYMACAGDNVLATYASLSERDWTNDTLPVFQENITALFDEILVDLDVRTFDHDLRDTGVPCQQALRRLRYIRDDLEEQGATYGDQFTKVISASDCEPEQLKSFLLANGFWMISDYRTEKPPGQIRMSVAYRERGFRPLAWLLNSRYHAQLIFSSEGRFIESHWGVPK